jgi:hypothetical protein
MGESWQRQVKHSEGLLGWAYEWHWGYSLNLENLLLFKEAEGDFKSTFYGYDQA